MYVNGWWWSTIAYSHVHSSVFFLADGAVFLSPGLLSRGRFFRKIKQVTNLAIPFCSSFFFIGFNRLWFYNFSPFLYCQEERIVLGWFDVLEVQIRVRSWRRMTALLRIVRVMSLMANFSSSHLWYNECMPLLFCSKWQMKTIGASSLYFIWFQRKKSYKFTRELCPNMDERRYTWRFLL